MPSAHGDFTIDHDRICRVDDSFDNRIGDRTVIVRVGIDAVIPSFGMVRQLCVVEDQELYDSISEETFFSKGLCAGFDAGVEYEDQGEPIHLYKSKVHPLMDCVFPVSGDSMEPDFHNMAPHYR